MQVFIDKQRLISDKITLLLNEQVMPIQKNWKPYYIYDIQENKRKQIVGTIVFRLGSKEEMLYSGHIGYQIEEEYRGNSYAYQACLLLMQLIKEHEYQEVVITCQNDNMASIKTILKLDVQSFEEKVIPKEARKELNNKERVNVYTVKVG